MIFHLVGGGGPIMGDLWALKGLIEEGISFFFSPYLSFSFYSYTKTDIIGCIFVVYFASMFLCWYFLLLMTHFEHRISAPILCISVIYALKMNNDT